MRLPRVAIATGLLLVGCAGAPRNRPRASDVKPDPLFEFHVGFWVNLHQRLYAESGPRPPPDRLRAATAEAQATWDRAVQAYRRRYPQRAFLTLLEDDELVRVNRQLSQAGGARDLASAAIPPALRGILEAAAPVYRQYGWSADERAGHAFIDRLQPLLARHGRRLADALARAYATPWPARPVRVDVAAYAGPVGAYTVLDPPHTTIASHDRRHAGDAAFEILFHEASHALVGSTEQAIARACAAAGKPTPPTLWHEILFYSTGELVRRELGAGYTPYAYRYGLYARSPGWQAAEPLLSRHWREYLDGRVARDEAIREIVAGLPPSPGGP